MKFFTIKKYSALIVAVCFYCCQGNDDTIEIETIPVPEEVVLSENIEIYNDKLLENSFVLAVENGGDKSYLLNKKGDKVHEWNFDSNLGNDLELLPSGKLIGMFRLTSRDFSFGGAGGIIKIINIDGSTDWEFEYTSPDILAHHDVEILPNGNVIFLAWERISASMAQQAGVNTSIDIFPEVL